MRKKEYPKCSNCKHSKDVHSLFTGMCLITNCECRFYPVNEIRHCDICNKEFETRDEIIKCSHTKRMINVNKIN